MHDANDELELLSSQQWMTTAPASDAASCRVRSPYPASAPGEAEASGAEEAPESAGPGEPTEGEASQSSPSAPQTPARRRLREPQLRDKRVHPRYNDDEFGLVQEAADLSHMALGGYVAESSLAAARSDDPTAAVADYRAAVKALMDANRQLAMVGSNLNQLTWHLNKDGAWPHHNTVQRLLERVEASIAELDTAIDRVTTGR
ncbi:plasmid mobilization relaxosome protein MobC [Streptomyces tubercidicus]